MSRHGDIFLEGSHVGIGCVDQGVVPVKELCNGLTDNAGVGVGVMRTMLDRFEAVQIEVKGDVNKTSGL